jgi:hypothetical protein
LLLKSCEIPFSRSFLCRKLFSLLRIRHDLLIDSL